MDAATAPQTADAPNAALSARPDPRPIFAIITGHLTPYRIAFHTRVAQEIPELRLATLVTKYRTGPWVNPDIPEIGTVMLDPEPPPREATIMEIDYGGRTKPQHVRHEFGTANRLWKWLEQNRPTAILCPGYDELPLLYAVRWAKKHGVPVFMSSDANIHGDLATGWKRRVKNIYVPRILRRFDAILVCGRMGKAFFRRYGVPDDKMYLMPLEPDYSVIENMTHEREQELCSALRLDPARKRIVVCCRLIPLKRVDLVIEAFKAIATQRPEWDLVIVGRGELQPGLEDQSGELLTQGRIKFLGHQDTERVAAVYRASHVLVLASNREAWALVVNEACCAGMAIVVSDRVGAAYELVSPTNGRVFPSENLEALAQALREATDTSLLEGMRQASRKSIEIWRREADSISGLRGAMARFGIPV